MASRPPTFVSATRLTAEIPSFDLQKAGLVPVFVVNPDQQRSNTVDFNVTPAGNTCARGQYFAEYFSNTTLTSPAVRTSTSGASTGKTAALLLRVWPPRRRA